MFRNHPVFFLFSILLVAVSGIGLPILLVWWLRCTNTTLIITDARTILRKGVFSKLATEIYHSDISDVQVERSRSHRFFRVGDIGVRSKKSSGVEIKVSGILFPETLGEIIDTLRRQAELPGNTTMCPFTENSVVRRRIEKNKRKRQPMRAFIYGMISASGLGGVPLMMVCGPDYGLEQLAFFYLVLLIFFPIILVFGVASLVMGFRVESGCRFKWWLLPGGASLVWVFVCMPLWLLLVLLSKRL
jgi:uncharacterized membrane protein YdbT with pleckstrin-like domain